MLVKKIKYVDYLGKEREEDLYFNLNDAEVTMWLTTSGDYTLDKVLQRLYEERNVKKIFETFEDLIHRSFGRISLDGKRFEKSEEMYLEFKQSEAYSKLFMELIGDAQKAADFFNGVIPKDLADRVTKVLSENPDGIPADLKDYVS